VAVGVDRQLRCRVVLGRSFTSNDEIFAVIDEWPDSQSTVIEWTASSKGGQYCRCWNNKGAGSGAAVCDDEIKEGAKVTGVSARASAATDS